MRGEQTEQSDVDILISFDGSQMITLFRLVRLELELSEAIGIKADAALKSGQKKTYRQDIIREVENLFVDFKPTSGTFIEQHTNFGM